MNPPPLDLDDQIAAAIALRRARAEAAADRMLASIAPSYATRADLIAAFEAGYAAAIVAIGAIYQLETTRTRRAIDALAGRVSP